MGGLGTTITGAVMGAGGIVACCIPGCAAIGVPLIAGGVGTTLGGVSQMEQEELNGQIAEGNKEALATTIRSQVADSLKNMGSSLPASEDKRIEEKQAQVARAGKTEGDKWTIVKPDVKVASSALKYYSENNATDWSYGKTADGGNTDNVINA